MVSIPYHQNFRSNKFFNRFWTRVAVCWQLLAMVCGHLWCFCQKSCRHSSLRISATTMWRGTFSIADFKLSVLLLWRDRLISDCHYTVWLVGNWCYGFPQGWCKELSRLQNLVVHPFLCTLKNSYALAPDLCLVSNVRPEPRLVDVTGCDYLWQKLLRGSS